MHSQIDSDEMCRTGWACNESRLDWVLTIDLNASWDRWWLYRSRKLSIHSSKSLEAIGRQVAYDKLEDGWFMYPAIGSVVPTFSLDEKVSIGVFST
jgi:hypothetical protein